VNVDFMADAHISFNPDENVELCMKQLRGGWTTVYEATPGEDNGYIIGLFSTWQKDLMNRYGDIVFFGSIDNACIGLHGEKLYLMTIILRDPVSGKGAPVAYMLSNAASHHPLKQFLRWLRKAAEFQPHTVVINCSQTEILGIREGFEDQEVHIIYSYRHLGPVWQKIIKENILLKPEQRVEKTIQKLRTSVTKLQNAQTPEEFDHVWQDILSEWGEQTSWIDCMEKEWLPIKQRWSQAWRNHVDGSIDTNNFIQAWHAILKRNYLGRGDCQQKAEFLIQVLAATVEPDFRRAHVRCSLGLQARRLCKEEIDAKALADGFDYTLALERVKKLDDTKIDVISFSCDNRSYTVMLKKGNIASCSCPRGSAIICKHMLLAKRVLKCPLKFKGNVLPCRRPRDSEDDTLEQPRTEKRPVIEKPL